MPPLGIAWLAAVLRENGYKDVTLIDAVINKYSNENIVEIIRIGKNKKCFIMRTLL